MARVNPIPEGCHSVQPYMMFSECAKAMEFYTKAFGAREVMHWLLSGQMLDSGRLPVVTVFGAARPAANAGDLRLARAEPTLI